ncbi:GIY-YIG nuclease family protein [Microbacterium sp. NPDC058021]|uniref:GIY-YIG nuclease family protein n=1 Tax=Microbacterium sp. NPDC058021 TaxID=3346306 RepID=UPI0036DC904A
MSNFEDAMADLRGLRIAITDAPRVVPPAPGLYAIYGDTEAWTELRMSPHVDGPLYIGKAEDSLARRELQGHFAVNKAVRAKTGSSTVRRSFAALLRETLGLRGMPRNPDKPAHFSNYGLSREHDDALTAWMHRHLAIAVWPAPRVLDEPLALIESAIIRRLNPPLNLSGNPHPAPGLSAARARMAAEARAWASSDAVV